MPASSRRLVFGSVLAGIGCLSLALGAADDPSPGVVAAWASGPLDVVVALSRPIDSEAAAKLVGRTIPYYDEGEGDEKPLGALKVAGARSEDDGRTLVLATDPHARPSRYVLPLEPIVPGRIAYNLGGVEAAWFEGAEPDVEPTWKGWLPGPDPAAFRDLAARGSAPHGRWAADLAKPGQLRLDALVKLPAGKLEAVIESSAPIVECLFGDGEPEGGIAEVDGGGRARFAIADASQPAFLSLTIRTGPDAPAPVVRLSVAADGAPARDLEPSRFLLPWASTTLASSHREPLTIPDLAGGDPAKGEEVFFSKEALCSQCHVVKGRGGEVGPDLTQTGRQGAEYLYRSIAAPSEVIVPDFVTHTVSLKDGRVAAGVVRAEGADAVRVIDTEAKSTTIRRDEIDDLRSGATSIMPVGLIPVLGEAKLRDLVAYLMSTPSP
ncbi:c-type cytochrome [Paludisphaera soli]|uniref:c-type cytochrome n=1 Tax=Paludisphaera soli TaxID=2712865 RepID=UPI0013ED856F|nr:c-type cytochrome [Paludisphaera soli]